MGRFPGANGRGKEHGAENLVGLRIPSHSIRCVRKVRFSAVHVKDSAFQREATHPGPNVSVRFTSVAATFLIAFGVCFSPLHSAAV